MTPQTHPIDAAVAATDNTHLAAEEQARRAGIYSLLAALLRAAPNAQVLDYAAGLQAGDGDSKSELGVAFATLSLAARHGSAQALKDEYHALFIGLGRGELVPFGSWYQTGFLMETPLAQLRNDLAQLGFERADDVHEPEDHIAALFEVMSLLTSDATELAIQRQFFETHIERWAADFFTDLANAQSAVFYRSVARLGTAYMTLESRYLSLLD